MAIIKSMDPATVARMELAFNLTLDFIKKRVLGNPELKALLAPEDCRRPDSYELAWFDAFLVMEIFRRVRPGCRVTSDVEEFLTRFIQNAVRIRSRRTPFLTVNDDRWQFDAINKLFLERYSEYAPVLEECCGHGLPENDPQAFIPLLKRFLKRLSGLDLDKYPAYGEILAPLFAAHAARLERLFRDAAAP